MFSQILRDVGLRKVADVTGLSLRQIYNWQSRNTLPRSDFTGETAYSEAIADASKGRYSTADVLSAAMQGRKTNKNKCLAKCKPEV